MANGHRAETIGAVEITATSMPVTRETPRPAALVSTGLVHSPCRFPSHRGSSGAHHYAHPMQTAEPLDGSAQLSLSHHLPSYSAPALLPMAGRAVPALATQRETKDNRRRLQNNDRTRSWRRSEILQQQIAASCRRTQLSVGRSRSCGWLLLEICYRAPTSTLQLAALSRETASGRSTVFWPRP